METNAFRKRQQALPRNPEEEAAAYAAEADASPDGFTQATLMRTLSLTERSDCLAWLNSKDNQKWWIGQDSISTTNLQMLNHGEWLSDEVDTFYFKLLAKRDAELTAENPGRTRSHFITSFFFTKLIDEERRGAIASVAEKKVSVSIGIGGVLVTDKRYEYSNVRARTRPGGTCCCWTRSSCRAIWGTSTGLASARSLRRRRFSTTTTSGGKATATSTPSCSISKDEAKQHSTPFDRDEWNRVQNDMHNTPQQQNVCDCGVFACTNADFLSVDFTGLNYTQPDIPEQRLRFVHKCGCVR